MDEYKIITNQISVLEKKYSISIETECLGLQWNFYVTPPQSDKVLEEIDDVLDDTLDIYEDAIKGFFTFDGHYYANSQNKTTKLEISW